jgi:hypothetical protein
MQAPRNYRTPLAALAALAILLAALALTACGASNETTDLEEGEPVQLGALQYNLIFSRYLNPADNEDSAYLVGQPPADPKGLYLGIFLQVKNQSDGSAPLPLSYKITDTTGAEYDSIPSDSLFALPLGDKVPGGGSVPEPDSTAQTGPIEGSMVLFEIPQSATENRPLKFVIPGPEEDATINLDL